MVDMPPKDIIKVKRGVIIFNGKLQDVIIKQPLVISRIPLKKAVNICEKSPKMLKILTKAGFVVIISIKTKQKQTTPPINKADKTDCITLSENDIFLIVFFVKAKSFSLLILICCLMSCCLFCIAFKLFLFCPIFL